MNAALGPDTKDALARELPTENHCKLALRNALAWYGRDARTNAFTTHRNVVARLFWSLLDERKSHAITASASRALRGEPRLSIEIPERLRLEPPPPERRCDRLMELRAAFLLFGVLTAGARGYHLELTPPDVARMKRLRTLLGALGVTARTSRRRKRGILYLKDFEAIVDLLARIGAHSAVLALEETRALRETKNRIHRLVNTEVANLARAARAAAAQRRTVEYIERSYGVRRLSPALREIATLRLRFPGESLSDLGRRCSPPIGKATVSSRLSALSRLAERLRSKRQGPPRRGG